MAASKPSAQNGNSGQSEDLSPPTVTEPRVFGPARLAELLRPTKLHRNARLNRTLIRAKRTKPIDARTDTGAKCPHLPVATEAMEQRQATSVTEEQLQARLQVSSSCGSADSEKIANRLEAAFSCPLGLVPDSKATKHGHSCEAEHSKRYSRKLNEFLRRSLLADIVPISPAGQRKATVIKFSHHQAPSQAHSKLDQIDAKDFSRKSADLRKTKPSSERLAADRDVDGGYAWVILVVIFIINASTFGISRAYGLIFDKLARDYNQTRSEAALPFTIMGAVENMAGPLSSYLLAHWNSSWRTTVFTGSCLISLAHFLTALSIDSQLGQLLSMGLLGGLGTSLVSISFFQLNNAYFVRYRSTAFGLGMTGAAFGTLYISPLCQYCLDNFGMAACYLMLGAILLPNVPLSLLLKPKLVDHSKGLHPSSGQRNTAYSDSHDGLSAMEDKKQRTSKSISERVDELGRRRPASSLDELGIWLGIKRVIANPLFHLIWPTQLLFCWLNFVFSMIIVDFGKDRGMSPNDLAKLLPCWAFGQLVGRLCLSSLVDFKCLSYKPFTVICLLSISITLCLMNSIGLPATEGNSSDSGGDLQENYAHLVMLALIFCLSMFIALLYILFNGLVVKYVEPCLQSLSIGISSFSGSFLLLPRAHIISLYRQTSGNYDGMLKMFSLVTLGAALIWLLLPPACSHLKQMFIAKQRRHRSRSRAMENLRVYSSWKLADQQAPICRHGDVLETATHTPKVDLNPNFYCYPT